MAARAIVLVIDDDFDFVEFARIVLESDGYDVLTAARADEGLALMRQSQPDLVLLDAVISYTFDGLNVIREMRNDPQLGKIPLILVSAIITGEETDLFPEDEGQTYDLFMSKPIDPADLLKQVGQLVSHHQMSRHSTRYEKGTACDAC
jgi:CheY-like chemotaxis protein